MNYEYKISQTIDGKLKIKDGVIVGTSSAAVTRELSEKIRDNATGWGIVYKKLTVKKKEIDRAETLGYHLN